LQFTGARHAAADNIGSTVLDYQSFDMWARYVHGIAGAWMAAGLLNASALVVLDRRYSIIIPFVMSSNSE
jgi:hypothetical protein